ERLAIILKGSPSGYQKDLQEDKEALFDTADTLDSLLSALAPAVAALRLMPERVQASLTPHLLAVELAGSLVAEGVPFRQAHALGGPLWADAGRLGTPPSALPEAMRVAISPLFPTGRLEALDYQKALDRRNHSPGTGPRAVAEQLGRAEARLGIGAGDGLPRAGFTKLAEGDEPRAATPATPAAAASTNGGPVLRRAEIADVPAIARLMADFVAQGVLLPRPVGELDQCIH